MLTDRTNFVEGNQPDFFNICVKIFEAQDLPHPNISSFACVEVGKEKKCTNTVKHTDRPYFNGYFVFDLFTDFNSMVDTKVTLSLVQPKKAYRLKSLIGCVVLELGTVWTLEDHTMRRWFVVSLPTDPTTQSKGFINCEIKIEAGEKYGQMVQLKRMIMPEVIGGSRARYIIKIYNCTGLEAQSSLEPKDLPDVHVVVSFAGKTEATSKYKLRENVEWNEQIMFIELFPPLFQNVTVQLLINNSVVASRTFYLTEMSFTSKDFFLPNFGPTYIHLYDKSFRYLCSMLLEIDTEIITLFKFREKLHACLKSTISAPASSTMDKLENFLLYGVIFDVVLTNQQTQHDSLTVSLNFGNIGRFSTDQDGNNTITDSYKVMKGDLKDCFYLEIDEEKPCVFARLECLDTRHRLSNLNMLARLAKSLREGTEHASNCISRGSDKEALRTIKACLKQAKLDAKLIPTLFSISKGKLDVQRVTFLTGQLKRITKINTNGKEIDFLFDKANLMLSILGEISVDIQDSLPVVFISVKKGQSVIGICQVQPQDIIFSATDIKKGVNCGKINSLFLKNKSGKIVGKLDAWLWLGLWDYVSTCLQSLPSGHEDIQKAVDLPVTLRYLKPVTYLGACHIFGGHLTEINATEGLCSSFVRVFVSCQGKETNIFRKSLAPMWKETLAFTDLKLCPSPDYVKSNPPMIMVELWDTSCSPAVMLGSNFVEPKVRIQPITGKAQHNLQWIKLDQDGSKILAAFEIVQFTDDVEQFSSSRERALSLARPKFLDPLMVSHQLEVVFWALRPLGVNALKDISQPQIVVNCGFSEISSNVLSSANTSYNFKHNLQFVKVELPETKLYTPPFTLRLIVSGKSFGSKVVPNIHKYSCKLPTVKQWYNLTTKRKSVIELAKSRQHSINESVPDLIPLLTKEAGRRSTNVQGRQFSFKNIMTFFSDLFSMLTKPFGKIKKESFFILEEIEPEDEYDWWHKYYSNDVQKYNHYLEKEKIFEGFNDVLKTFVVTKNNAKARPDESVKVKLMVCLYKWPVDKPIVNTQGQDPTLGVLAHTDLSDRVKLLVRVYCLQAHHLHPADLNGSADPFIEIATSSQTVSDQSNFVSRQLNPVFGTCLELFAEFPKDTVLSVRVMDYDRISQNDCIGETNIDLENRFYSKHRATCGLPKTYSEYGHNKWRDIEKPTKILERLCNSYNLPLPEYYEKSVVVASKEFVAEKNTAEKEEHKENLALNVLNHWKEMPFVGTTLVPEHVESRPLYNKNKPRILQGRLELWVDLFDLSLGEIPPPVNITKRLPKRYELRLIVWNTSKVPLVDNSFFVGKRHTDILVKAWLYDHKTVQSTDVHFTSTNGEGNFNWRFVFPLDYYSQENKMVVYEKGVFDIETSERKVPPLLHIQVWDNDRLSPNDFIGSMVLELNKMPRGASSKRNCKVNETLTSQNSVDLFRVKHLKGWWAFTKVKESSKSAKPMPGGLLEAEIDLLTAEEAVMSPVGLGRDEPAALPPPDRPEIRARFWLAPLRILQHLICGVHKGKVLLCLLSAALVVFLMIAIYSIPMFIIKKIIGA